MRKVGPKVEEAIEALNMKDGPSRRKLLTGTGLVSASAAAAALLTACTSSSSTTAAAAKSTDTGLTFVTKTTVNAYLVPSRFEGSPAAEKVIPRSGPINNPMPT